MSACLYVTRTILFCTQIPGFKVPGIDVAAAVAGQHRFVAHSRYSDVTASVTLQDGLVAMYLHGDVAAAVCIGSYVLSRHIFYLEVSASFVSRFIESPVNE